MCGNVAPDRSPKIDARSGALRQFMMAGDEIGVQMRFDNVLDLEPFLPGGFEIDVHVALRVDYGRYAF